MNLALTAILLILMLNFTASAQTTDSNALNNVYKLAPEIYDVKGMGEWSSGGQSGQIRLVITRKRNRDAIFLQWVVWNNYGPTEVISTVAINEVNKQDPFKVTFIRKEVLRGKRTITLGLENRRTKQEFRAMIKSNAVGQYNCVIQ